MKRILQFLFVIPATLFLPLVSSAQSPYCAPSYYDGCIYGDNIDNFSTTNGITNISNLGTGCSGSPFYSYDSTMIVSQIKGLSFNVHMQTGGSYPQGFTIWIDWNKDNDFFDAGEEVYNSGSGNASTSPFTGTVNVPSNAPVGKTRDRKSTRLNSSH